MLMDEAEMLVAEFDPDNAPSVALANFLEGRLWTGDMKLYKSLIHKKMENVLSTEQLFKMYNELLDK